MADKLAPSKGEMRVTLSMGWMTGAFFALVSSWEYSFMVGALIFAWGMASQWDEQRT